MSTDDRATRDLDDAYPVTVELELTARIIDVDGAEPAALTVRADVGFDPRLHLDAQCEATAEALAARLGAALDGIAQRAAWGET